MSEKKNVSPAYAGEYREWIHRGRFEQIYRQAADKMPEYFAQQHPAMVGGNLHSIATCYYTRGTVALLDDEPAGWKDIQCGYWAALYSLGFELKAVTLPAWSSGRKFGSRAIVELVLTLGLAKLFRQEGDVSWLRSAIAEHFSFEAALGDKVTAGRKLLQSILDDNAVFSFQELLKDRKECCQKRDAWFVRPTEVTPFGVIDIEAILRFPREASFSYPDAMGFQPTEDNTIVEAVTAFHTWYE